MKTADGVPAEGKVKPIAKHEKCGIRNKKGAGFTVIEREKEAQYGILKKQKQTFEL